MQIFAACKCSEEFSWICIIASGCVSRSLSSRNFSELSIVWIIKRGYKNFSNHKKKIKVFSEFHEIYNLINFKSPVKLYRSISINFNFAKTSAPTKVCKRKPNDFTEASGGLKRINFSICLGFTMQRWYRTTTLVCFACSMCEHTCAVERENKMS